MYQQRPPGRPRPLPPEEIRRRREYLRRQKQRQMQRRIAILSIVAVFVVMTVILLAVALHRSGQTPVDQPDIATDSDPLGLQTTAPIATTSPEPATNVNQITICIDPGHGYDDPGTESEYLGEFSEKDVTLAISLKLRDMLTARGYNVIMTHEDNVNPPGTPAGEQYLFGLAKRTEFANTHNPDFYLSIHCDSYDTDKSVSGIRVYYQAVTGANNDAIAATAQCFVDGLASALPNAKKAPLLKSMLDDDAYYVLRNTLMPAVLVEVGFVTNPDDAANMLDETWQTSVAEGLARGIEFNFPI